MRKPALVRKVAEIAGIPRYQADLAIRAIVACLRDDISQGGRFGLHGLGCFRMKRRAGKIGRDPKTGERIALAAGWKVYFRPARSLKKLLT